MANEKTNEKKYRIIFEKDKCIGAAACNSVSDSWLYNDKENKSNLLNGKLNSENNTYELEIDENNLIKEFDAARLCPVKAIHIEDIKTKRRLI